MSNQSNTKVESVPKRSIPEPEYRYMHFETPDLSRLFKIGTFSGNNRNNTPVQNLSYVVNSIQKESSFPSQFNEAVHKIVLDDEQRKQDSADHKLSLFDHPLVAVVENVDPSEEEIRSYPQLEHHPRGKGLTYSDTIKAMQQERSVPNTVKASMVAIQKFAKFVVNQNKAPSITSRAVEEQGVPKDAPNYLRLILCGPKFAEHSIDSSHIA